jgi:hypothetical protein
MTRTFFALLLLLAFSPESAISRDWFVNPDTGSDQNEGSQGFPLKSAQEAVNLSQPGDRILLFPERSLYRQTIQIPP